MCWEPSASDPRGHRCPCEFCDEERRRLWREEKTRNRVAVPLADGHRLTPVAFPIHEFEHAACASTDKELFFPIGEGPRHAVQIQEARKLCFSCPHRVECRDEARQAGSHGIWGGETEDERISAGFSIPGRPATRSTR